MLNQYHRCVQILRQIWNDTLQRLRTARRTCKRNDLAAALDRMSGCCNRLCGPRRSRYSLSLRCDAPFAIVTLGRAYRRSCFLNSSPFASITLVGFVTKSTAPRSIARIVTSASLVVVVLTMMTVARILSFCNCSKSCSPSMRGILTSRTTPS